MIIIIIITITTIINEVAKKLTNRIVPERGQEDSVMMYPIIAMMRQEKNIT